MPENYDFDQDRGGTDWEKFKRNLKRFGGKTGWIIIAVVIAIYLLQGLYQVGPAKVGLVKRFGKHVKTVNSGLKLSFTSADRDGAEGRYPISPKGRNRLRDDITAS